MTRRPFLVWHRWFGLAAAAWLFLIGLSGSIIVFYHEIDRALNPQLFKASAGPQLPVAVLAAKAEGTMPGYKTTFVDLPDAAGDSVRTFIVPEPQLAKASPSAPRYSVYVDPATGAVLGKRSDDAIDLSRLGIVSFIYKFHYSLHLGDKMIWVIGLIAFLWIFDHAASVILSFPSRAKWLQSFQIRRGASGHKRIFDIHRAGGLWLFPITLTLAITGLYFNWPNEFKAVVNAFSPVTPAYEARAPKLAEPLVSPQITFDAALRAASPARVDRIAYNADYGIYKLRVFDKRDLDTSGRRMMIVDARDGRILSDRHVTEGTAGDVILAWQFPLHSGKAFGWWGRIAIFISGIMLCVFVVTGVLMWHRKWKARRSRAKTRLPAKAEPQPAE